ncbi:MAG: carboxypeptidase regulatory-like domain-containing protein, partial [Melioribacteraceae bacterium]|nr:carboxypeptidase regulatory-like domain-containing protein [Melioribacteraceae bacterium]MCF8395232.1 carboxypeptidase regulatory-like domain-containing protein [Melioribacteraceae bacterium]MCF8420706.1 carboxypeptidase regulatory-like domain-containing protein [Melioribacteraceae bacterium]
MTHIKNMILFLTAVMMLSAFSISAQTVVIGYYEWTYNGVTYDYENNTSTFTYTVSGTNSGKDLSHWDIALCEDENDDVLDAGPGNWEVVADPTIIFEGDEFYGLKFDSGLDKDESETYSFTLNGIYDEVLVDVAYKAGRNRYFGTVTGPSCEPMEPEEKASIGDKVWYDEDQDGKQDEDEDGVEGVTVKLYDCDNNYITSTTTDDDGEYIFDELDAGEYKVKFVLPEGYEFTSKDEGEHDYKDSDADETTGFTECTELEAGENDETWDAGIYETA